MPGRRHGARRRSARGTVSPMSKKRRNNQQAASGNATSPTPSKARKAVVAGRWGIAVALAVVVVAASGLGGLSAFARGVACAALAFLFANALWQHMSLGRAGALAFVCAVAVGIVSVLVGQAALRSGFSPFDWAAVVAGAAIGTLVARPMLRKIDRLSKSAVP